ncbi:MAG: PIN domain-containing protein [Burkholderiales bacterium]
MIGIDTNVLVRYIAQDDVAQSRRAVTLIEKECSADKPGYVGLVVLVEVVWVSESVYRAAKEEVTEIVRRILSIKQLAVQDAETAWKALRLFESNNADFADCLLACTAVSAGCGSVVTFDKQAAKIGMTLLK